MPNEKRWQDFRESLMMIKSNVAEKIEIGKQNKYINLYNKYKFKSAKM